MTKPDILEAIKIQARAVIPIVKALESEVGRERALGIVGSAIANDYAKWQSRRIQTRNQHPRSGDAATMFPVETQVVEDTAATFGVNMTKCQFAEYFRSIGEPEIGALLTCGVDFANEATQRPDWKFTRTQTLMNGAPFCDFRWRLKDARDT